MRHYSRRSDYRLDIRVGQKRPLACVNHELKRVQVTTAFPAPGANAAFDIGASGCEEIRAARFLRRRPTAFWLRGFLAHEAGHILFSEGKPKPPTLGWLWNSLEDERMERLMAKKCSKLGPIFSGMGDVMLSESDAEMSARLAAQKEARRRASQGRLPYPDDVLRACLNWRWLHDHALPSENYHPYLRLPQEPFEKIRPLIEKAWARQSSDDVTEVAREILDIFGIDENRPVSSEMPSFDLQGGEAAGGEAAGAAPQPPLPGAGKGPEEGEESSESIGKENASEEEPDFPGFDPAGKAGRDGGDLLEGLEADVRALGQVLRPPSQSHTRTPHRTRGRFSYRRYAGGAERVYRRRRQQNKPPAFVTVLLDLSGSMKDPADKNNLSGHTLLDHAKRAAALVSGAAEVAGTGMRVIPFRLSAGDPIESAQSGHERLRAALSAVEANSCTRLGPALQKAVQASPAPGHGRHLVALISDGDLEEQDVERCKKIYRRAQRSSGSLIVLPLLIGAALDGGVSGRSGTEVYQAIFGRYADVTDPADLPDVVRRWLGAYA